MEENITFVSFGKIIGIPGSRGLIRKILSNCFICKRQNAKPAQTQMANLPNIHLQSHVKPFSNTGVDYFGLIQTKTSRKTRRNQGTLKTYGINFTCLSTAIHIELSGDLSTDSFIVSLRRFFVRRGHVNIIQSDNGTNFIGAVKEINDAIKNHKHDKIIYLNKHQIKWQFNPPLSPWMGDCWESLIKTIKRCLYAMLKNSITTAATLTTVLCEVEYMVNNRPLLPIYGDINDYDVLTPNNFLLA